MKKSEQTDIDSSLTIKYLFMGIVVVIIAFMIALVILEAFHFAAESMKKITSYSFAAMMGGGALIGISRLFDPERKEREKEALFASIRQAMKEQGKIK